MRVRFEHVRKGLEAAKRFLDPPLGPDAQPVEVRAAVVDAIERKIAILGVGRLAFPYDGVTVRLAVPPTGDKAAPISTEKCASGFANGAARFLRLSTFTS